MLMSAIELIIVQIPAVKRLVVSTAIKATKGLEAAMTENYRL